MSARTKKLKMTEKHIEALQQIAVQLISSADDHKLLDLIVNKAMELLVCDAGSLYLKNDKDHLIFSIAINQSIPCELDKKLVPIEGQGIAAYTFRTGKTVRVVDVYNMGKGNPFYFDTLVDRKVGYRTRSVIAIALKSSKGEHFGVLQLINRKRNQSDIWNSTELALLESMPEFDEADQKLLEAFAALASAVLEKSKLYESIENLFEGFIRASVRVIEERDPGTRGHSERVAALTVELAKSVDTSHIPELKDLKFNRKQLQEIHYAALLHDFGKVSVSERVLLKQEKLYEEELLRIRSRIDTFAYHMENSMLRDSIRAYSGEARVPSAFELAELDRKIRDLRSEFEYYWDVIKESNRPTVLDQEVSKRLGEIRDKYITLKGMEPRRLLEQSEFLSLSIGRGSLNPQERREIENHVTKTFHFLKEIPWTQDYAGIPEIAHCHHEKLNGTGYPRQLKESKIPIQSKMMTICDIYDALVAADRPYKKSLPTEKALEILSQEVKEGKIDPLLFRVFIETKIYVNSEFLSLNPFKKAA